MGSTSATYHRESGERWIIIALLFVVIMELTNSNIAAVFGVLSAVAAAGSFAVSWGVWR